MTTEASGQQPTGGNAAARSLAPHAATPLVLPSDLAHGIVMLPTNVRIHYVVAGEGDPVVLIPGYPQSWYTWRFVIPRLAAQGRRVYAIDPRGNIVFPGISHLRA